MIAAAHRREQENERNRQMQGGIAEFEADRQAVRRAAQLTKKFAERQAARQAGQQNFVNRGQEQLDNVEYYAICKKKNNSTRVEHEERESIGNMLDKLYDEAAGRGETANMELLQRFERLYNKNAKKMPVAECKIYKEKLPQMLLPLQGNSPIQPSLNSVAKGAEHRNNPSFAVATMLAATFGSRALRNQG